MNEMEGHSEETPGGSPNHRESRSGFRGQRYVAGGGSGGGGGGSGTSVSGRVDFPLRILVLSDMVGAIIGRSGGTIRSITQETRARVDVHRKENSGSLEKVITIYGNAENCSKACQKIMEVMQIEANNTSRGEIPLKILAHNNLIGRIIGKNGNTIKRIMEETNTKITVSSSIHDVNSFNLERVITIEGKLEDICSAEQMISLNLRQSYEYDLAIMAPQTLMFPGLHPLAMMSTLGSHNYPQTRGTPGPGPGPSSFAMYGNPSYLPSVVPYGHSAPPPIPLTSRPGSSPLVSLPEQIKETVYLYIPNVAVGAIIGTKGNTIKDMINSSGASIKVEHLSKDEHQVATKGTSQTEQAQSNLPSQVSPTTERKVTIIGSPEAQWKAQFMIFRKVGYEGLAGPQEATLKVEIMVPSSQVGRIIGKGGGTVRDLQCLTNAIIKLPEESQSSSEDTPVHIIGDFLSNQAAQRQIRALVSRATQLSGGPRNSRLKSTQSPVHPNHQQQLPGEGTSKSFTSQQTPTSQQVQQERLEEQSESQFTAPQNVQSEEPEQKPASALSQQQSPPSPPKQ